MRSEDTAVGWFRHDEAGGWTSQKLSLWVYIGATNKTTGVCIQNSTGVNDNNDMIVYMNFRNDGFIKYYTGSFIDTGQSYTVGWHLIEIVLDVDNDQFDMWYDTTKIVTNGAFWHSSSSAKSIQLFSSATGNYWDDVQIGESEGHGMLLSSHRNRLVGVI